MKHEKRIYKIDEIRMMDGANGPICAGHVVRFNQLSENLGGFREKVAPGAFRDAISSGDVCAFWSHRSELVLGRTSAGTVRLEEDTLGLAFSIDMPDTTCGRDAVVSIKRGDVTGMSFGFDAVSDTWERAEDGTAIRTLLAVRLFEISPTALPAYPQSSVSARALEVLKKSQEGWAWDDHVKNGGKTVAEERARIEDTRRRRRLMGLRLIPV